MNKEEDNNKNSDSTSSEEEKKLGSDVESQDYEKLNDDYLRLAAEFENYKKRIVKDQENITLQTISMFALNFLPIIDSFEQAIDAGVLITGCSVHLVESKVDSGPLLIQAAIPVKADDNIKTLSKRIQDKEHLILPMGVAIAAKRWRDSESLREERVNWQP